MVNDMEFKFYMLKIVIKNQLKKHIQPITFNHFKIAAMQLFNVEYLMNR